MSMIRVDAVHAERTKKIRIHWCFGCVSVAAALLCGVLWADEDYHMAAAIDVLHGKTPYRDFWYDKPPLAALYYLLMGAVPVWFCGFGMRRMCCCVVFWVQAGAGLVGRGGRALGGVFACVFTTFYLPAAVIPFAPDALLIAPHLAAVYFARKGKPLVAGCVRGWVLD